MPVDAWVVIAVILLVAICLVAVIAYAGDVALAHAQHEANERAMLTALTGLINQKLRTIQRDLLFLARETLLERTLNHTTPDAESLLAAEWIAFSRSKTIYDKLRWIDETGKERIRVNYVADGPVAVATDELQDRSLRYFFQDTLRLQPLEIYMSPFDLNVEGEHIEQPYKPTIRFGTPLFDEHGQRRGILMLNYSGASLFERIEEALPDAHQRFWLLNADGYWLYNMHQEESWGFMFERDDQTLAARKPTVWARILAEPSGQFVTKEGLWTFDTVYPLLEGQKTSSGSARLFSPSQDTHLSKQYFWKVVTLLPLAEFHQGLAPATGFLHKIGRSFFRLPKLWRQARLGRSGRLDALEHEALAAQVVEHTAQGVMIADASMRVHLVNGAFTRITGYGAGEIVGRPPFFLQSGGHPTEFYQTLWAQVIKDRSWQGEVKCRRKNGELFAEWLNINTLRNANGVVTHYICLFSDISELKESEQRMEYFAHHDTLTGLANSRLLQARLEHSIQLAQRGNRQFALLFIDLDRFKSVNDTFGHLAGDALLKDVAHRLSTCLRNEDTLARIGGDEFVVLLENVATQAEAQRVVDLVLKQFPCTVTEAGQSIEVTASIGISFYPRHGNTAAMLLGRADHAMYEAKRRGTNGFYHSADTAEPEPAA